MVREKLELPLTFPFATEFQVRIDDVNYGGHLGNASVLTVVHEARLRFLSDFGFSEKDVDGVGMIMSDAVLIFKAEAFHWDVLVVEVAVANIGRHGCDFLYRITRTKDAKEIARAKTGLVFFDYERRKVARTPNKFKEIFAYALSPEETDGETTKEA